MCSSGARFPSVRVGPHENLSAYLACDPARSSGLQGPCGPGRCWRLQSAQSRSAERTLSRALPRRHCRRSSASTTIEVTPRIWRRSPGQGGPDKAQRARARCEALQRRPHPFCFGRASGPSSEPKEVWLSVARGACDAAMPRKPITAQQQDRGASRGHARMKLVCVCCMVAVCLLHGCHRLRVHASGISHSHRGGSRKWARAAGPGLGGAAEVVGGSER